MTFYSALLCSARHIMHACVRVQVQDIHEQWMNEWRQYIIRKQACIQLIDQSSRNACLPWNPIMYSSLLEEEMLPSIYSWFCWLVGWMDGCELNRLFLVRPLPYLYIYPSCVEREPRRMFVLTPSLSMPSVRSLYFPLTVPFRMEPKIQHNTTQHNT